MHVLCPDVKASAKASDHLDTQKLCGVFHCPPLLHGKAETDQKNFGAAFTDPVKHASVFLTMGVEIAVMRSADAERGQLLLQCLGSA